MNRYGDNLLTPPEVRDREGGEAGGVEGGGVPTVSQFYGIAVRIYYGDHPPPHFHVYYGSHEALVDMEALEILEGSLPKRAWKLVLEWASEHREELLENWELAQQHQPLKPIEPLE